MSVIGRSSTNVQVEITAGRHQFIADEPLEIGDDAGPNPYDLLLSALASCTIMTLRMFAQRKGWPLEDIVVKLSTQKVHARDCEICESSPKARVDVIDRELTLTGDLTPAQMERLTKIAERCPVHRTLTSETVIRTTVV